MSFRIQVILIVGSITFLLALLTIIRKGKMTTDLACLWIALAIILVVLAIFPNIAIQFGYLVGIISSINAVFLVLIFLILCLIFYLFLKVTTLEKKLNDMIQRYAIDKNEEKSKK